MGGEKDNELEEKKKQDERRHRQTTFFFATNWPGSGAEVMTRSSGGGAGVTGALGYFGVVAK